MDSYLEFIKTLAYGVVEGITEWLPVSSTGHLILLDNFLPLDNDAAFMSMFRIVIQLGAIIAVLLTYCERLWPFKMEKGDHIDKEKMNMWAKIVVACLPAGVVGLAFEKKLEDLFYNNLTVAIALIVVGILFLVADKINKKEAKFEEITDISFKTAFCIGLFQLVAAIFPGVSRSGATIMGAMFLGVSKVAATEFSFFLAVPVMFGASLVKLIRYGTNYRTEQMAILAIGFMSAYFVSMLAIRVLIGYIQKHSFNPFAIYRIILGVVVIVTLIV